jgi:hypothetical protein
VHFILINPVFSDHLSYMTLFQSSHGRSHKTGLSVLYIVYYQFVFIDFSGEEEKWKKSRQLLSELKDERMSKALPEKNIHSFISSYIFLQIYSQIGYEH